MEQNPAKQDASRGLARWCLIVVGLLCSALAIVGAFLPLLPTTPFLLVASACFVRSSPRFHRRILASKAFGPYLAQWQHDHTVPIEAKRKAYGLVVLTFSVSIFVLDRMWIRGMLAGLGIGLIAFLAWLPTTTPEGTFDADAD